jgi:Xaa-Pro aminopeptidase
MIPTAEFTQRRKALLAQMQEGDLAIIPAAHEVFRNNDTHYPFRQHSDFHYLTGYPEPDAVALLFRGGKDGEYLLFNWPSDPAQELWTGPRVGQLGAIDLYGADQCWPLSELATQMPRLLSEANRVLYNLGANREFDTQLLAWLQAVRSKARAGVRVPSQLVELSPLLHEMRLLKSPSECAVMRRAAEISAQAHALAMRKAKPGLHEYELEAVLQGHFYAHGCQAMAYPAIVGSGANACVLHYVSNNAVLGKDDLVLIDAGAECQQYAADITRTFPVNGRFSGAQAEIYDLVLQAQLAAIAKAKVGVQWYEMQAEILRILTEGLVALGILKGDVKQLLADKAYLPFYMHNSGHWLGLDVHDVGAYKEKNGTWRRLEAGMVLTVEPGLYIRPSPAVPEAYWNIGIRIEDDVLVTAGEPEVFSAGAPKQRGEIEHWMRG